MAQHLIPEAAAQAMDETAAWAFAHMSVVQPANRADDATIQRSYDVLQQSLEHYRRAERRQGVVLDYSHFCGDASEARDHDDSEPLTHEQAVEQATAEWLSTPAKVAAWLQRQCDAPAARVPADGIDALEDDQVLELPVSGLLAVAMTGTNEQALMALRMLREAAVELNFPAISKRAGVLQAVGL